MPNSDHSLSTPAMKSALPIFDSTVLDDSATLICLGVRPELLVLVCRSCNEVEATEDKRGR